MLRQSVIRDFLKRDLRWTIVGLVALFALLFQIYSFTKSGRDARAIQARAVEVDQTATDLLAAIGFSGVVHDFKNCVLRASEPDYCDRTRAKAARAQGLVERLEDLSNELGVRNEPLTEVRKMIAAYDGQTGRVLELHRAGAGVAEIDAAVRVDDFPATEEIQAFLSRIKLSTQERLARIDATLRNQIITSWIAFMAIVAWLFFALRREARIRRVLERAKDLSAILDTINYGVVGLTRDKNVAVLNPAARHMLGGLSQDAPFPWPENIKFLDQADLQPLDASEDPVERLLAGAQIRDETHVMTRRRPDSASAARVRYVRLSYSPVEHSTRGVHAVLALEDVTEAEIRRQQMERASRLDALGQLTGGIAHDFNNILATIQSALQLVLMREIDKDARKWTETSLGAVRRGAALADRLLSFARKQPAKATSRSADEAIAEVLALMRPTIEMAIDLRSVIEADDLMVFCDQGQLENAIVNLILNSRDSIIRERKGDAVIVEARGISDLSGESETRGNETQNYIASALNAEYRDDHWRADGKNFRYIEIAVTDNGPGMAPEVKSRAVDPFFTTKGVNSGTGLGLSMVYGFVQQAGGELRIYSEVGQGTTVRMILPRGVAGGQREAPVERLPQPTGEGQTVLLVEDELDLLTAFSALVASLGYNVLTASNGAKALEILRTGEETVDLLLTDIVMPGGVGGFELAEMARELRPDLPVIYMSGYTGFSDREGSVQAPMLPKPCAPSELARALANGLSQEPIR